MNKKSVWPFIHIALLVFLFVAITVLCMNNYIISFDAAMNDQVSLNLATKGQYATNYIDVGYNGTTSTLFDHKVQTGSTVIMPAALLDRIFGFSSQHMQFVLLCYYFLLLSLVFYIIKTRVNWLLGYLVVLFCIPFTAENVFCGYGEVAMFSIMLASLFLISKAHCENKKVVWILTGLAIGWGYLTKTVFLICIPAFGVLFIIDIVKDKGKYIWNWCLLIASSIVIVLLFELYKFVSLKDGFSSYIAWWKQELSCIATESGTRDSIGDLYGLLERISYNINWLANQFHTFVPIIQISICTPLVYIIYNLNQKKKVDYLIIGLFAVYITYLGWWFIIVPASRLSERRILSAFIASIILLACIIGRYVHSYFTARKWSCITVIMSALIICSCMIIPRTANEIRSIRAAKTEKNDIKEAARYIQTLNTDDTSFWGIGWWQNPVIAIESNIVMHNLECEELTKENNIFVEDVYMRALSGALEDIKLKYFCEVLYQNNQCSLYRIYENRDEMIAQQGDYLIINAFMPYWGEIRVTYNDETVQTSKYTCMYDHVAIPAPKDVTSVTVEFLNFEDNISEVKGINLYADGKNIDLMTTDKIQLRIINE